MASLISREDVNVVFCFGNGWKGADKAALFMQIFTSRNIEAIIFVDRPMRGFEGFLKDIFVFGLGYQRWKMSDASREYVGKNKSVSADVLYHHLLESEQQQLEQAPQTFKLVRRVAVSMQGSGQKFHAHIIVRK